MTDILESAFHCSSRDPAVMRPNILFIITDDPRARGESPWDDYNLDK